MQRIITKQQFVRHIRFYATTTRIHGLEYLPNFITEQEEKQIVNIIDQNEWIHAIRRRTQYYGPVYYHTRHQLPELQPAQLQELYPLNTFQFLVDKFVANNYYTLEQYPTQCLVNEYTMVHGIAEHVDDSSAFGSCVVSLSLLSPCVMAFTHIETKEKSYMLLEPRSLLILRDQARYEYKHGIPNKKSISIPNSNQQLIRDESYRRLSLTFRKLNMDGLKKCTSS
jgi:alkylated DNA repair dioxygenase AlkB